MKWSYMQESISFIESCTEASVLVLNYFNEFAKLGWNRSFEMLTLFVQMLSADDRFRIFKLFHKFSKLKFSLQYMMRSGKTRHMVIN